MKVIYTFNELVHSTMVSRDLMEIMEANKGAIEAMTFEQQLAELRQHPMVTIDDVASLVTIEVQERHILAVFAVFMKHKPAIKAIASMAKGLIEMYKIMTNAFDTDLKELGKQIAADLKSK